MYEDVIELVGQEPGPTSMILVGVHGNERCGIEAINKLLSSLKVQKGRVLIGYGNPKAIEQNVRFVDSNLNRLFKPESDLSPKETSSYEYARAQFLKQYLDQADVLLDVHASLTPESQRFLICEEKAEKIAQRLPFPLVVAGFDEVEPGGTDYYMNQKGKVGICAECGYVNDVASIEIAENCILNFLIVQGNILGESKSVQQSKIQIEGIYLTKSNKFTLKRQFKDFEQLNTNEVIGVDGEIEIKMPIEGIILFARNRNQVNDEAFLYGCYKK